MRFSDILCHEKNIEILKKTIKGDRVGHAYIFSGPEGVGKRTTALAFASALNCENQSALEADSCGECKDCELISRGAHPNVFHVEPEKGVLKIDAIRQLQKALIYTIEKGKRVAIVDGADLMVRDASAVLLKTLEEPPPNSVIALISARPYGITPTILSRCQRFFFRPLRHDVIKKLLIEKKTLSAEDADVIARLSCGSLLRAFKIAPWGTDQEGLMEKRRLFFERFSALTSKNAPKNAIGLLDFAERFSKDEDIEELLEFLKSLFRDMAVYNAGKTEFIVNRDMAGFFKDAALGAGGRSAGKGNFEGFFNGFNLVEEAKRAIMPPRNANKTLTMETLLIGLLGVAQK